MIGFLRVNENNLPYPNISILDISDRNNYKWLDTFDPSSTNTKITNNTANANGKKNIIIVGSAVGGAIFIVVLVVTVIFFSIKKRKGKAMKIDGSSSVKGEDVGRFDSDSNTEVVRRISVKRNQS